MTIEELVVCCTTIERLVGDRPFWTTMEKLVLIHITTTKQVN